MQVQFETTDTKRKPLALQVIQGKRKNGTVKPYVGMNRHVIDCILRLTFQSELDITSFRQVAKLAGAPEPLVYAVIRDHGRSLGPRNFGGALRAA